MSSFPVPKTFREVAPGQTPQMNKANFLGTIALLTVTSFASAQAADEGLSFKNGEMLYRTFCIPCHQEDGQGLGNVFPPLAQSDYLLDDKARSIRTILQGLSGTITVNGKEYTGSMPSPGMKHEQIADVLTYVRKAWGNNAAFRLFSPTCSPHYLGPRTC